MMNEEQIGKVIQDIMYTSYEEDKSDFIDAPENWEKERREELFNTVETGIYELGVPGHKLHTGKGGYIEFQIAMEKSLLKYK